MFQKVWSEIAYRSLASCNTTDAGVSREKAESKFIFRGFKLLDPRRQTSADLNILNTNLHLSMHTTVEYDSFRFSAIFNAKRLIAEDICDPIPPDDDMIIGVKSAFSTLAIRSAYSLLLVSAANL